MDLFTLAACIFTLAMCGLTLWTVRASERRAERTEVIIGATASEAQAMMNMASLLMKETREQIVPAMLPEGPPDDREPKSGKVYQFRKRDV